MHIPESTRRNIHRSMFGSPKANTENVLKFFKSLPVNIKMKIVDMYEKKTMQTTPRATPRRSPRTPPRAPKKSTRKTAKKSLF